MLSDNSVGIECCEKVLPWGQVVNNLSDVTARRNDPIAAGRLRSPQRCVPVSCAQRGTETVDEPWRSADILDAHDASGLS